MKKILVLLAILVLASSCAMMDRTVKPEPQEIVVKVQAVNPVKVDVSNGDQIHKSMEVHNPDGSLSNVSFISGGKGHIKLYSSITVGDAERLWSDFCVLKDMGIFNVELYINSPGGDAFSGLALADQIKSAQQKGFHITAHAAGIVASAAVPILAVCDKRYAFPGAIFMVHETAIWKWPGRETHSEIRSQNALMDMLRLRYLGVLADHSKLSMDEWGNMEGKTTWFTAQQAKDWGLVDEFE